MAAPGMTTQDTPDSQIEALEHPMFAKSLKGILRACWCESAAWGFKRGNADLIKSYQEYEWRDCYFPKNLQESVHLL